MPKDSCEEGGDQIYARSPSPFNPRRKLLGVLVAYAFAGSTFANPVGLR